MLEEVGQLADHGSLGYKDSCYESILFSSFEDAVDLAVSQPADILFRVLAIYSATGTVNRNKTWRDINEFFNLRIRTYIFGMEYI